MPTFITILYDEKTKKPRIPCACAKYATFLLGELQVMRELIKRSDCSPGRRRGRELVPASYRTCSLSATRTYSHTCTYRSKLPS